MASSHLAIDQGPIVVMIENHRSALLWTLFMSAPEVLAGLTRLGLLEPAHRQGRRRMTPDIIPLGASDNPDVD